MDKLGISSNLIPGIIPTTDKTSVSIIERKVATPDEYVPVPPAYAFARGNKALPLPKGPDELVTFNSKLLAGYEVLYSTPEAAHDAYSISKTWAERIQESSPHQGINNGEAEIVSNLSIQRRFPPYYYINAEQLPEGTPSPLFKKCLRAYLAKIAPLNANERATSPLQLMMDDEDPFDTNQGYPTYSSEPAIRFLTASAVGLKDRKISTIIEALSSMADFFGYPGDFMWPAAVARRSGALSKSQRYYRDDADNMSCISDFEVQGVYTRGRKVYMMPFYFNILASPVARALKLGRTRVIGFGHDSEGESKYLPLFCEEEGYEIGESDLSGYDASIRPAYRKLLWSLCREFGYDEDAISLLEAYEDNVVILSAPWNMSQDGSAAVVRGRYGLLSGLKVTTEVGSALSIAATLKALVVCGALSESALAAGNWPPILMLGDDILLKVKKGSIKEDLFKEAYTEEGLKVKYLRGNRFLMNHILDGKKYGVASRIIQQTLFNEDSYTHVGQVFLALASRLTKPMLAEHWPLLQGWAAQAAQIVRLPEPFNYVATMDQSTAVTSLMNHDSVASFLISAAGQDWLSTVTEKAKITPFYQEMLAILATKGFTATTEPTEHRQLLLKALFNPDHQVINEARDQILFKFFIQ